MGGGTTWLLSIGFESHNNAGRRLASYFAKGRQATPRGDVPKITSRNSAASAVRSVAGPLQRALFVTAEETLAARACTDAVELQRRAIISTAAKYLIRQRFIKERRQINDILLSRKKALSALREISPKLHAQATDSTIVFQGVPLERRMLTLTLPVSDVSPF